MKKPGTILRAPWLDPCIAGLLLLLVLIVYAPVRNYGFVDYDDSFYVTHNQHVLSGLNLSSLRWALTSTEFGNWFPLTWLSLMADRQFFAPPGEMPGIDVSAGPQHWTNVMLHAASTLLLFALLKRITGASGASALVAFLFGLHPLHVESVAWVAERKDVLSAVLWMLALLSYARYASRPKPSAYLLTLLLYCLGFLAKPMVVTLPLVFVLLDFWPLRRTEASRRWLWEKIPFLILAAVMSVVTFVVQRQGGAVRTLAEVPWSSRLENAVVSAAVYGAKFVWPARLAVLYPLPPAQPLGELALAGLVLAGITYGALRLRRTSPYLAVGWFWYLITLVPVIGIVQVGMQARADRYTYLPSIGLSIMTAWGIADVWRRWARARLALIALCAAGCTACVAVTMRQIPYWKDSVTLFRHTIDVTGPNPYAHGYLGQVWEEQVMYEEAVSEFRQGLAIAPHSVALLVDLGGALRHVGRAAEAVAPLTDAVERQPLDERIHEALGMALAAEGRVSDAQAHFEEAIRLKPDYADAHDSLGVMLERAGRIDGAIAEFTEALRIQPNNATARKDLRRALAAREQMK